MSAKTDLAERHEAVVLAALVAGNTFAGAARRAGVTRERARQIAQRWSMQSPLRHGKNNGPCHACERPAKSRGLCVTHYWRLVRLGSTELPKRPPRKKCSLVECNKPHRARGLCATHYHKWWYGNVLGAKERQRAYNHRYYLERMAAQ